MQHFPMPHAIILVMVSEGSFAYFSGQFHVDVGWELGWTPVGIGIDHVSRELTRNIGK